jgi:hypothetical protein
MTAEVASHRHLLERDTAVKGYDEALTIANELGMRPLIAHCHLGVGKLYRRTGEGAQAREHLTPRQRCTARWR